MCRTFSTRNRRLENFLFVHGIRFASWYKDEDYMTVWEYVYTPEVARVVAEWDEIQRRIKAKDRRGENEETGGTR